MFRSLSCPVKVKEMQQLLCCTLFVLTLAACSDDERMFLHAKGKCQMTALARSPKGTYEGALSEEGVLYTQVLGACMRREGFRLKEKLTACSGGYYSFAERFDDCWERP
jgi:hypothetical protein